MKEVCDATGMRKNVKKRVGIAMGSYHTESKFKKGSRIMHKFVRSINWIKKESGQYR